MSRTLKLKQMFVWKYLGTDNYPGYNFAATPESCDALVESLEQFLVQRAAGERLILKLPPVTRSVLKMVNSRVSSHLVFSTLKLDCCSKAEFRENCPVLEMSLNASEMKIFIDAIKAMSQGIGDFDALGAFFWPIRE